MFMPNFRPLDQQTKPEISTKDRCQIEGLDDTVATIYNTSPLVEKKWYLS